ncbi:hypothetical protein BHE74_00016006 [Ensete ventricosum]|nr:hypothetical protein BHE74_00016006 [Ensete ventricosum]
MSMNLKEEGRYVVNRGEDLTVIDFDGDVSLAEKLVRHRACATEWMVARNAEPQRATTDRGEESTPTVESWSEAVDSVAEASIISKRLSFDMEDSARSDGRLMEEKVAGSRECSGREEEEAAVRQPTGSGCGSSRRALLGGEGAVGRRSNPITIKQRGGARRLCCSSTTVSWFADLGRGVKDDGSKCCDWLRWEAAAAGWRRLRGWSLDLRGLPSVEEKSGHRR